MRIRSSEPPETQKRKGKKRGEVPDLSLVSFALVLPPLFLLLPYSYFLDALEAGQCFVYYESMNRKIKLKPIYEMVYYESMKRKLI
jgi:hypothetical protein